jgi:hypothetical protein
VQGKFSFGYGVGSVQALGFVALRCVFVFLIRWWKGRSFYRDDWRPLAKRVPRQPLTATGQRFKAIGRKHAGMRALR